MKERLKILWLPSWYPNRSDPFDGDFIQRHARAAAIHHDIHVLFISAADEDDSPQLLRSTGLTEQLLYMKKRKGLAGKLFRQWQWRSKYMAAIDAYIRQHGRPDAVHVHVAWKAGLMALYIKARYRIPYLLTEHWGIYDASVSDHLGTKPSYVRSAVQQVVKGAARIITVSSYLSDCLLKMTGRKGDSIIPNVVDTTLFYPGTARYERFTFLHVSNMVPLKNVDLILEAFQRLGVDAQLVLVGNRDAKYVQMAEAAGLLNVSVFFRGEVSYREVAEEMRRAHCLVTYSDTETFSCVTAEALCAGLPVIAAATGALPELVHKENGILVDPRSATALEAAMREMISKAGHYDAIAISQEATARYGYGPVGEAFAAIYGPPGANSTRA